MVSMARTPWMVGMKTAASSPWRSAQRVQTRSAARVEVIRVPSMSNRKA
jgi:hypothetical protein